MTELAINFDELDDHQELKRRGPYSSFWQQKRLRRSARVALTGIHDKPSISVTLRRIRDNINADHSLLMELAEPAEKTEEVEAADPMAVALPPLDKLRSLGASACQLPEEFHED
ncbi:hypothetical protein KW794_02580 [Candidatus Saccharibacteria bacterium]|nr:hypothetical protein [Candidatus Saccharibacteria bacterium]